MLVQDSHKLTVTLLLLITSGPIQCLSLSPEKGKEKITVL